MAELGTPPVQFVGSLQRPLPPFHTEVWAEAHDAKARNEVATVAESRNLGEELTSQQAAKLGPQTFRALATLLDGRARDL